MLMKQLLRYSQQYLNGSITETEYKNQLLLTISNANTDELTLLAVALDKPTDIE